MQVLGMQGLYSDAKVNSKLFEGNNPAIIGMLSIILFMVAAFVFFSLAFILIARFVMLLFLIITSPIGFAGLAVPKLESLAKSWWSKLFEQTITAPVLLLLLYIALRIITDPLFLTGFGGTNGSNTGFWTGTAGEMSNAQGFMSMFLSFLVAMGLLLAVVIASKKMSAFGASGAVKWAGRATFGLAAMGASAVIGGGAFALRRGIVQRFNLNPNSRLGRLGIGAQRLISRGLRATEGARMDMRWIPGVGAGLTLGGAAEAAEQIQQSAVRRIQQGDTWVRTGGTAANQQFDTETKIPRLIAAANRGDIPETNRLMRTVTDDELRSRNIENLIDTQPNAVRALTNHQASLLPDRLLIQPGVYQHLSATQLEAYRQAGNVAPTTPGGVMETHLEHNQYAPFLATAPPHTAAPVITFWHF